MSRSRSRRRSARKPDRLRARRKQADRSSASRPRADTRPHYPLREFLAGISLEERQHLTICLRAQAAGDPETAALHYVPGPYASCAYEALDLLELVDLGEQTPPWAYSRWIARQAHRWLGAMNDPSLRDCLVRATTCTRADLGVFDPPWLPPFDPDTYDPERDEPDMDWAQEVLAREFVTNWVAFQLCVYESGGMEDFLGRVASPRLIGLADQPRAWASARLGAYAYGRLERDTLTVLDLRSGQRTKVLHIGAASEVPEATTVLGRLVPIAQEPGLMFESRPLVVDPTTARAVADGLEEAETHDWTETLWDAVSAGRLDTDFAAVGFTPLTSDLLHGLPDDDGGARAVAADQLEPEDAARVRVLKAAGLSEATADGVRACEIVLEHVDRGPQTAPAVAAIVAQYLADDRVYEALLVHCTQPRQAAGWARCEPCLLAHLRPRCRVLVNTCAS